MKTDSLPNSGRSISSSQRDDWANVIRVLPCPTDVRVSLCLSFCLSARVCAETADQTKVPFGLETSLGPTDCWFQMVQNLVINGRWCVITGNKGHVSHGFISPCKNYWLHTLSNHLTPRHGMTAANLRTNFTPLKCLWNWQMCLSFSPLYSDSDSGLRKTT